ncbi:MAG: hypothetical protein ACYDBB_11990 [Armatimonadota bacterium]
MQRITFLVGCIMLAMGLAMAGNISVLEKDGRVFTGPTPAPPYAKLLADNGFNLGFPQVSMRETAKLNLEMMRKYNVVVIPTLMGWTTDMKPEELTKLLDDYLKAGGGVLVFQLNYLEGIPHHEALNAWLKQYGASLRWEEIVDEAHQYKNPPSIPWQASSFFWTDNIAKSPITSGVKNIFYVPSLFRGPYMAGLNVDKTWQVLVSTAATAKSYKLQYDKSGYVPARLKDAPAEGAVPLLAVRKVGKGRLAIFGGSPAAYWYDLMKPVYAGVPQERGDGQRASDWQPLLFNLLRWLGEPGSKSGKPGGYAGQVKFQVQPDWGNRTPINWEKVDAEGVSPELVQQTLSWHSGVSPEIWKDWDAGKYRPYKALIGAHTQLTGGKGTVADWKAAAKAAGYSIVIFRENILQLSEEQWKAFQQECKAASDAEFRAVAGQEFEDWIGNKFMRFNGELAYPPHKERITDGKVRDQLSWFFDVGWPVNLPISPMTNPTEPWNYRVYDAFPIYVYQNGQLKEDCRRPWEELVDNYEYSSPLVLHLLDDPKQVAQAATQANTFLLSNGFPDFKGGWAGGFFGSHNNPRVYSTTGPVIDRFQALNMYRTTLGSRGVPGSYRYRLFIKAHADKPIARVEVWGGDEPLRIYRPNAKEFSVTVEEMHDRQRGLWLKVVDADGGEARATGIMVHDKMQWFVWCGDHCNALPAGLMVDNDGSVFYYGISTRVKSSFQAIDGPGAGGYDMYRYVPWGTDTSAPAVGTQGQVRLFTADGKQLPDADEWYTSRVQMPYGTRDVMVERLTATRVVHFKDYVPKFQPTINGWYPYTKNTDLQAFTLVHEDADFHRDAAEPAFQWNTGTIAFKQDVTLSSKEPLNILLANFNTNTPTDKAYTNIGELPKNYSVIKLGKGGYLTWGGQMGNVTGYSLDDDLTLRVYYDGKKVIPSFGYNFAGRQFKQGEQFRYQTLIMRWPTGVPLSDRLDAKVASVLNLADSKPGYSVTAKRGKVVGTQFILDLQAQDGVFDGQISRVFFGVRMPVRISGLNPRWTAAAWQKGVADQILAPLVPRAAGEPAYLTLDLEKEAGDLFIGNLVTCDQPALWLRVLQRADGGFDLVAHNPGEAAVTTTITGIAGGPLEGWKQAVQLAPGEEKRMKVK